jgi:UDP-N-acetylglucosamine 1-carboxyvinyltransferase
LEKKRYDFKVIGGNKLGGSVFIQGSKNAILPMIAASLIPKDGYTVIKNVPPLNDILAALEIARHIGADVCYYEEEQTVVINATNLLNSELPSELTGLLRASILFIPPLLARLGHAKLLNVGGCSIGNRKLDYHYRGLARLGAVVSREEGFELRVGKLNGSDIYLDFPTHTGTENLMMMACVSQGNTVIENVALDPEVIDFGNFLNKMGARIMGLGTGTLHIRGVDGLHSVDYTAMPDRLDTGAFVMTAGITGSKITLIRANLSHLLLLKDKLEQMGIEIVQEGSLVHVKGNNSLKPINIITCPYPGLATDFQPGVMTLACLANGTSYIRERIFEGRFSHAEELNKMGAKINILGSELAVIKGPITFKGTQVQAHDIRAGISLLLGSLVAQGITTISNVYQIDRGHYSIEHRLNRLGAKIRRISH